MHRRPFLAATAACFARTLRAAEAPRDARITRVVGFNLTSRPNKLAGKNARLDVHCDHGRERRLRIYTSLGVEGIGNSAIGEQAAASLLGKHPFDMERGWRTLVADGETQRELAAYKPFIETGAIDVFQGAMNHFGIDGILAKAAMARPHGARIAPHNWGTLVGYYLELHVGLAVSNFYRAEHDPLVSDVLVAEGYRLQDGLASVPDAPGSGISIDEAAFVREVEIRFDLKA